MTAPKTWHCYLITAPGRNREGILVNGASVPIYWSKAEAEKVAARFTGAKVRRIKQEELLKLLTL